MNSEHARCVGWLQTYRRAYTNHFSPTLSYPNCGIMMAPVSSNVKHLLSHLQRLVGYLSALQQIGMGVADSVAAFGRGGMCAMQMNTLSRLRTRS